MYSFSEKSKSIIKTLHADIQFVLYKAIEVVDFSVDSGYRDATQQNALFREGKSQLIFDQSKHNKKPSQAVDIYPYPLDWEILNMPYKKIIKSKNLIERYFAEIEKFYFLAGVMKTVTIQPGINMIWGGDWDNDNDFKDNNFDDLGHFELTEV